MPSRRFALPATVVLAAAVVVVVILVTRGGGSKAPAGAPASTQDVRSAALGDELLSLLSRGSSLSYHARYVARVSSPSPGSVVTLEVWRTPARTREDTTVSSGGTERHTAAFVGGGRAESCVESEGGWRCSRVSGPTPATLIDQVRGVVRGAGIAESDASIAGHHASCYTLLQHSGARYEVCLDSRGVPLRISAGGTAYVLTALDGSVPDSVFTPPAAG